MGVENILVIVNVKHYLMPGELGQELFKMVIDWAKELLTSLHLKVLEAEKFEQMNQVALYNEGGKKVPRKSVPTSQFSMEQIPES